MRGRGLNNGFVRPDPCIINHCDKTKSDFYGDEQCLLLIPKKSSISIRPDA
jgi:hypothetical protein